MHNMETQSANGCGSQSEDGSHAPSSPSQNGHSQNDHGGHSGSSSTSHQEMMRGGAQFRARAHALGIMSRVVFEEGCKQRLICQATSTSTESQNARSQYISGVALRIAKQSYASWPRDRPELAPWLTALCVLNVGAAMTLRTTATEGIIDMLAEGAQQVILSSSSRIQVLENAAELSIARKAQGAAFVRQSRCIIVWSDAAEQLLESADRLHSLILKYLWNVVSTPVRHVEPISGNYFDSQNAPPLPLDSYEYSQQSHEHGSPSAGHGEDTHPPTPRSLSFPTPGIATPRHPSSGGSSFVLPIHSEKLPEGMTSGPDSYDERPMMRISAVIHGLACALALVVSFLQVRDAVKLSTLDGDWSRLAIVVTVPFYFVVVMFLCDMIFSGVAMLFGPVSQLKANSRYFSGTKPAPLLAHEAPRLPRITVHMPVYKESMEGVLKPSFESIKKAVRTYELQGGSASIIVSEDGLALVDEEERTSRLAYYEENNMTWVARPKHNDEGYQRSGRFKKASNLNFTYEVMHRVETRMQVEYPALASLVNGISQGQTAASHSTLADEAAYRDAYNRIMQEELAKIHPRAAGSGVDRMGDLILLVDCDTRIPEDCFLDAATEMVRSKDVAVLQHCSGVMIVSDSFFERLIGAFTKVINFSISYSVANGDVAPFMGHNAYLRWTAMKEVAQIDTNADGSIKSYRVWSEEHVSEDFVMALDLIDRGYITRWATYSNGGYEEGVSLSCTDELNRWQKYAWGVSEIVFNKLWQWPYRGPTSKLFNRFVFGPAPAHYKWSALSYCFSYYAIGIALPATLAITLVQGWIGPDAKLTFLPTLQVLIAVLIVYIALGSTGIAIVRFRAGIMSLWRSVAFQLKLIPFSIFFFGGLSYHCMTALIAHIVGLNMSWGSTLKDIELHGFHKELPAIIKHYYKMFILVIAVIAGTAILLTDLVPLEWRLFSVAHVFPLFFIYCLHLIFPFVLNPNIVRLGW